MITVTLEKRNGVAIGASENATMGIESKMLARPPQPLTANTTSSKCRLWVKMDKGGPVVEEWLVTETYATVKANLTADDAEAGAELLANKDASGGYAGLTLYKLNLVNNAATYTSTLANTNTAARAYTLPDVSGGVLVGAKIATGALVAGVRTVTVTGASTSSTAVVMTVALGGTVAAGGYKVACTADTVTITALQADGTTTETACTSTVQGICIL